MDFNVIDIPESKILDYDAEVAGILLFDHTTRKNIMWCTDDYASLGSGYHASDEITIEKITGEHENLIRPRALKTMEQQRDRTRDKAEVFTPSWICNAQNNLVDNAWFGREGVFNTENNNKTWTTNTEKITFPKDKTWKDYIRETCLEITCGEAPYLASRYDTVTGGLIPLEKRIGLLDRKMRVIGENADNHEEWLKWVQVAYQNIYGYEWQGDNLLLARESLLQTFFEYHARKFGEDYPLPIEFVRSIAYIISWNLWQMDGLKGVVPGSCDNVMESPQELSFLEEPKPVKKECPGCKKKNPLDGIHAHIGTYSLIMDWEEDKPIKFVSLVRKK